MRNEFSFTMLFFVKEEILIKGRKSGIHVHEGKIYEKKNIEAEGKNKK